jgi:hypothetical protein
MRTLIANALQAKIAAMPEFKTVEFDRVRLTSGEFQDWELPACQLIDLQESNSHERGRARKLWQISVEIIMGPLTSSTPTQTDLWDLMEKTEQAIFETPNLGIAGMLHVILLGSSTDTHLMEPWYLGRLDIQCDFYQSLTGSC